ncbi:MAG TPA: SHOCT domain-containing protein [Candidatus Avamphibacillus sp.]|nr:SHOCT domain-containing protein [Candidatus Avamphibacillus sp.]
MMQGHGSFWSMFLMIIFWLGLISFGIFLITNFINGGNKKTPLQIIKERLAKGEIDELEYERLKSIIEHDGK